MPSIAAARSARLVRPWRRAGDEDAGPERLGQDEPVARPGAALAQQPVGMGGADDRQPVLRLRVADGVAAGERAAGLADLGRGAGEDLGQHVARQVLGEGRDRQREQDPAAHREDVGQGVGRGDLAERPRVVDERREEVERADDREVVADAVDGGVVGRVEAGDQVGAGAAAASAPRPASASASRSAPSFAAQPPQSVSSVRRNGVGSCGSGHAADETVDSRATIAAGAVGSRWVPWSSKPVARRSARRGGFDSHAFPPSAAVIVRCGTPFRPPRGSGR